LRLAAPFVAGHYNSSIEFNFLRLCGVLQNEKEKK
jgi:hypothetical protein